MKAIILLSGGLDCAVLLGRALNQELDCVALTFDYDQRCRSELEAARELAEHYGVPHHTVKIDTSLLGNTSLLEHESGPQVPENRPVSDILGAETPNTYVPGRNTLFFAHALSFAEVIKADEIHIGAISLDLAYPDCRKGYFACLQNLIDEATKRDSDESHSVRVVTPFVEATKVTVVTEGHRLNVPFEKTMSCYNPPEAGVHCGKCDSCFCRRTAFTSAELLDPTHYAEGFVSEPELV